VIEKAKSYDYVDVEITPTEQEINYGESASYRVTVRDKHTGPVVGEVPVSSGTLISSGTTNTEDSITRSDSDSSITHSDYVVYYITVKNLPFHKEYQREVRVRYGGSASFELVVKPYMVRPLEPEPLGDAHRTGQSDVPGGTPGSTDAVQAHSGAATVTGRAVTKVVTEQAQTRSGAAVDETQAVITESGEPSIAFNTDVSRKYRFSVTASQRGDYSVQDTATAYLTIKPEIPPVPPPFPKEKVSIKLYTGWNLISLPGKLIRFDNTGLGSKLIGFVYLKEEQKYVTLKEAEKILGDDLREYLMKNAFWVYSRQDTTLTVYVDRYVSSSDLDLVAGWNLVPITEDMIGGYLEDIMGDCDLEKLYKWDAKNQKWEKISLSYSFSGSMFGYGFLVKANNNCKLIGPEITPPPMPE